MSSLRLAFRQLLRSPGFTALALVTLALGIGLNASMFSLLNVLLLRPLPYPDSDRLVRVFGTTPQARNWALTAAAYVDLRDAQPAVDELACFVWWGATLTEPGRPAEVLVSLRVSPEFLPTLRVRPQHGRWFTAEENAAAAPVGIISHSLWTRRFGADPGIVGRTVRIDTQPVTVVGVMPAHLRAPLIFGEFDLIRPIGFTAREWSSREERNVQVIGRLRPGQRAAQLEASLRTIAARLETDHPDVYAHAGFRVVALHASGVDETARRTTWFAVGLAAFVLLIACANLANLQLVRASGRVRITAICTALGASRWQLVRPLFWESVLLSLAGGALGLVVAVAANGWIGSHVVLDVTPSGHHIPLDGRVLVFAAVAALVTGIASGTLPGWWLTRADPGAALKAQGRGSTASPAQRHFRRVLVISEFALALVLLAGAGLLLGGLRQFLNRQVGWNPAGLASGYVPTSTPAYQDPERVLRFYEETRDRLEQLPGVEGVAFGWELPVAGFHSTRPLQVERSAEARTTNQPVTYVNGVLPGFFRGLDIELRQGRDFTRDDRDGAPRVAIVNETLARTCWPGRSPLGQRIALGAGEQPVWLQVVGVVADIGFPGQVAEPPTRLQVYVPFAQDIWRWGGFAVRTRVAPGSLLEPLRRVVSSVDPDLPVWQPQTIEQRIDHRVANSRLIGQLLTAVAVLGFFLAALGIYGVVSHMVAQRTSELGVRLALGASPGAIRRLVLGSGLSLALVGILAGAVGATVVARAVGTLLPEVPCLPVAWLGVVALGLAGAAVGACWLPARRAMRIDPIRALRSE